jgi:hypothetical protein
MTRDNYLRVRPGQTRTVRSPRAKPFIAQALATAERAGRDGAPILIVKS